MQLTGLYQAKVTRIGPKNERTGIVKTLVDSAQVDELGMTEDVQVDKRYHGGPHRALHQYALRSYEKIIKAHPLLHSKAVAGTMGENLSFAGMHEENVCIGDTYALGECHIQVAGPRMPCFKIAEKFSTPKLDRLVAQHGIHGWYYRVLKGGEIKLGDSIQRLSRPYPNASIKLTIDIIQGKITDPNIIRPIQQAPELDPEWQQKFSRLLA